MLWISGKVEGGSARLCERLSSISGVRDSTPTVAGLRRKKPFSWHLRGGRGIGGLKLKPGVSERAWTRHITWNDIRGVSVKSTLTFMRWPASSELEVGPLHR